MAASANEIEVVEVNSAFRPSAGPSNPVVWQDEVGAVLVCETDAHCPDARGVFRFQSCLQTRFGYPNDEALPGHPLYGQGLRHYALFEVINSPWITTLAEQNRIAFPDDAEWPHRSYRHFVVTFEDSTFEALCLNVGAETTNETSVEVFRRLGIGETDRWRPDNA